MRILVTGSTGQVGTALLNRPWSEGVEVIAPRRAELDLLDATSLVDYVSRGKFAAIINCAAYTAVDRAESDMLTAWKINALAPAAFAEASSKLAIPLLHVSTDYVFDGYNTGPHKENDPINPLGVYAASKAAGEYAVRNGNANHVVLRTSWVFSSSGANFMKTMLRLGQERTHIRVVDDQTGAPTSAYDIASALQNIVIRKIEDPSAPSGLYHFSSRGSTTWYGFAREIFAIWAAKGGRVPVVEAISTSEYPTPACRPANSLLDTAKIARDFGVVPPRWQEALAEPIDELWNDYKKNQEKMG